MINNQSIGIIGMDESFVIISDKPTLDSVNAKPMTPSSTPNSISQNENASEFMDSYYKVNKVVKILADKNNNTISSVKAIAKDELLAKNRENSQTQAIQTFTHKMNKLVDSAKTSECVQMNNQLTDNDTTEMNKLLNILSAKTYRFVENSKQDNQIELIREHDNRKRLAMIAQANIEDVKTVYNYNEIDYTNIDDVSFKSINETKSDALCHLVHDNESEAQLILKNLKSNKKHFMDAIFD